MIKFHNLNYFIRQFRRIFSRPPTNLLVQPREMVAAVDKNVVGAVVADVRHR